MIFAGGFDMKIVIIDGDPKKGGFIPGCLGIIAGALAEHGADVEAVRLADRDIRDCVGCFQCLRTGECPLDDAVAEIIGRMRSADGLVLGSPVRNGLTTACYKRFIERITYPLGFTLDLEDTYTLAVGSVGYMGGKGACRALVGLQGPFHTRLSGVVFHAVGMPTRVTPEELRPELTRAADRLLMDIATRRPRGYFDRIQCAVDRALVGRLMLRKHPEAYAHVIARWRAKKYL
jgi:multimeric flavodoxin WrbA